MGFQSDRQLNKQWTPPGGLASLRRPHVSRLRDNAVMRVTVNGVRLYFDVEGCGLAARDREMVAKPTIVLLHGGPGADHSLFKPEFSALA